MWIGLLFSFPDSDNCCLGFSSSPMVRIWASSVSARSSKGGEIFIPLRKKKKSKGNRHFHGEWTDDLRVCSHNRFCNLLIAFDRTHTIYVFFHSCAFYEDPRVLIADARSFQAFDAILDHVTHSASISCWYRSNARQDEFRLNCEFQKYKVITMSEVGGPPKKHYNTSCKATKHIEHTFQFLIITSCGNLVLVNLSW